MAEETFLEEDAILLEVVERVRVHAGRTAAFIAIGPVALLRRPLVQPEPREQLLQRDVGEPPLEMTDRDEPLAVARQRAVQQRRAAARLAEDEDGPHLLTLIRGIQQFVEIPEERPQRHEREMPEQQPDLTEPRGTIDGGLAICQHMLPQLQIRPPMRERSERNARHVYGHDRGNQNHGNWRGGRNS